MITLTENQKLLVTTLATGDMNKLILPQTLMLVEIMLKIATSTPVTYEEWQIICDAIIFTVDQATVENHSTIISAMAQYLKPQPTPANN